MVKLKKSFFSAGSPYSSWLKEELVGEIGNYLGGMENRGFVEKYKVRLFDGIEDAIVNDIASFDDYPEDLKAMAIAIIRAELDPSFTGE